MLISRCLGVYVVSWRVMQSVGVPDFTAHPYRLALTRVTIEQTLFRQKKRMTALRILISPGFRYLFAIFFLFYQL